MIYLPQILWLLTWPMLIYISYRISILALRYFETKQKSGSSSM